MQISIFFFLIERTLRRFLTDYPIYMHAKRITSSECVKMTLIYFYFNEIDAQSI